MAGLVIILNIVCTFVFWLNRKFRTVNPPLLKATKRWWSVRAELTQVETI